MAKTHRLGRCATGAAAAATCLCLIGAAVSPTPAVEPNYVRVTTYAHDEAITDSEHDKYVHQPQVTTTYADGLGRTIQTQRKLDVRGDADALVSMTRYDEVGRPVKTYQSAPDQTNMAYLPFSDFEEAVESHRHKSGEHPFAETVYDEDPLGRVRKAGFPGDAFAVDQRYGPVETWHMGVCEVDQSEKHWFFAEGFVRIRDGAYEDWETHLDNIVGLPASEGGDGGGGATNYANPTHFLTVTKDPNGNFTQELRDGFGRVVKRGAKFWDSQGNGNKEDYRVGMISEYDYDILGNVLREQAPKGPNGEVLVSASHYKYNTVGQLEQKFTPDAKWAWYEYDDAGRLERMMNTNLYMRSQEGGEHWMLYDYDELGRNTLVTYEIRDEYPGGQPRVRYQHKVRHVYDDAEDATQYVAGTPMADKLKSMNNTRGRVAVSIAYCEECAEVEETTDEPTCEKVIDGFSYDDEGRVEEKWKYVPGVDDLQYVRYTYSLDGKVVSESFIAAGPKAFVTEYSYDANGRLLTVERNGTPLVTYEYFADGKVKTKKTGVSADPSNSFESSVSFSYNERDWLQRVSARRGADEAETMYQEDLGYNTDPEIVGDALYQYNGNISYAKHRGKAWPSGEATKHFYQYDAVNRLVRVRGSGADIRNENSTIEGQYDADFEYDNAGRFVRKWEGPTAAQTWGSYQYQELDDGDGGTFKTSRLLGVEGKHDGDNYLYDHNGNMVYDKSRKMSATYDYRNLPVLFKFYSYSQEPADLNVENVAELDKKADVTLLSTVTMLYDAAGQRVRKQEYKP